MGAVDVEGAGAVALPLAAAFVAVVLHVAEPLCRITPSRQGAKPPLLLHTTQAAVVSRVAERKAGHVVIDANAKQERARAAALAAAAADGERLRDQVRAFAAACGGGEAQTVAAAISDCRDRAATLGALYEAADRQAGDFASAAEKHADEIRTLKRVIVNDRALSE